MIMKQQKLMMTCIICALVATIFGLVPVETGAESCSEMEEEGLLLHQQFKKGKVCKYSGIGEGGVDCLFKAGDTEIRLVSAITRGTTEEISGFSGGGFDILSVGPEVRVIIFADDNLGLLVKVEDKDKTGEGGCIFNEAYITLDSQVLSPSELNKIEYSLSHPPEGRDRRIMGVQKNLLVLGYRPGKADGILGPRTKDALEAYKRDKDLQTDLSDEAIYTLLATDALSKRAIRLEKVGEAMWQPR